MLTLRTLFSLALVAALSFTLVAASSVPAQKTGHAGDVKFFNCPEIVHDGAIHGAVIRLTPCADNKLSLATCTEKQCGKGRLQLMASDPNKNKSMEWLIVAADPTLKFGSIRLLSQDLSTSFLVSNTTTTPPHTLTAKDKMPEHAALMERVKNPDQAVWRWNPTSVQCRVILTNELRQKSLGVSRTKGKVNNIPTLWNNTKSPTDQTWEVQFVRIVAPPVPGSSGYKSTAANTKTSIFANTKAGATAGTSIKAVTGSTTNTGNTAGGGDDDEGDSFDDDDNDTQQSQSSDQSTTGDINSQDEFALTDSSDQTTAATSTDDVADEFALVDTNA